jgi:hypothetical protein
MAAELAGNRSFRDAIGQLQLVVITNGFPVSGHARTSSGDFYGSK